MEIWELSAREAIRHTLAAYNGATDRFRLEDLAGCFTEDGVLAIGDEAPLRGRRHIIDGLPALLGSGADRPDAPSPQGGRHVRHFVASTRFVAVSPESAEVSSYFCVLTEVGLDHWGRYRDTLVPVGEAWLLASRRVTTDGFSADSRFR